MLNRNFTLTAKHLFNFCTTEEPYIIRLSLCRLSLNKCRKPRSNVLFKAAWLPGKGGTAWAPPRSECLIDQLKLPLRGIDTSPMHQTVGGREEAMLGHNFLLSEFFPGPTYQNLWRIWSLTLSMSDNAHHFEFFAKILNYLQLAFIAVHHWYCPLIPIAKVH